MNKNKLLCLIVISAESKITISLKPFSIVRSHINFSTKARRRGNVLLLRSSRILIALFNKIKDNNSTMPAAAFSFRLFPLLSIGTKYGP